ncbi:RluA family pseudouridine synthase [Paracoccus sp. p4-l81]|uniref:RluA family pseudouridine synthase n=1 Tax=Paracoccus sp. p4-l81 TaxID=3342806 RepID=UPI0035BB138F
MDSDEDDFDIGAAPAVRIVIGPSPPDRLDKALARDVPEAASLSRSRLAKLLAEGAITRDGTPVTSPKAPVTEGEVYQIALPEPDPVEARPEPIPLVILHEDADLIVIDKPAGMVVHPGAGQHSGTLVNALLHHCAGSLSGIGGRIRPGIVHRIDKETSGLLVAAKSDRAHQGLAAQFEAHSVHRHYLALTHGLPEASDARLRGVEGVAFESGGILRIATQLGRHPSDRQKQAVLRAGGRAAVTRARIVERFGTPPVIGLVDCWLETGRTHQIRVHLAHAGHGLVGDPTYGGRRKVSANALPPGAAQAAMDFPRQALHAATLGFVHPVSGAELRFESPLPADMAGLIAKLSNV